MTETPIQNKQVIVILDDDDTIRAGMQRYCSTICPDAHIIAVPSKAEMDQQLTALDNPKVALLITDVFHKSDMSLAQEIEDFRGRFTDSSHPVPIYVVTGAPSEQLVLPEGVNYYWKGGDPTQLINDIAAVVNPSAVSAWTEAVTTSHKPYAWLR